MLGPRGKRRKRGLDATATTQVVAVLGTLAPADVAPALEASASAAGETGADRAVRYAAYYKALDITHGIDPRARDNAVFGFVAGVADAVYLVLGCGPFHHAVEIACRISEEHHRRTGCFPRVISNDILDYKTDSAATTPAGHRHEFYYGPSGALECLLRTGVVRAGSVHHATLLDSAGFSIPQAERMLPALTTVLASGGAADIFIDNSFE